MKKYLQYIYQNVDFIYKALIFLVSLSVIVYFFPKTGQFKYEFEKNKPWLYENLYAPFDFSVQKNDKEYQKERDSVIQKIPYYLSKKQFDWQQVLTKTENAIANNVLFDTTTKNWLLHKNKQILKDLYQKGIMHKIPDSLLQHRIQLLENNQKIDITGITDLSQLKKQLAPYFSDHKELLPYIDSVYRQYLQPNLFINKATYTQQQQTLLQKILPVKEIIKQGDLLLQKGEIINKDKYDILKALQSAYKLQKHHKYQKYWIVAGYGLLVAIVLLMLLLFLHKYRPEIFENNIKLSFIFFNLLLMIILTTLVVEYNTSYVYIVPLAILPLILKAFFDARVGLFVHVLTVLLLGFVVVNSFEFVFLQIMAGIVTILTVSELTKRANLFSSVGSIVLIYIIGYFAFHIIHEGSVSLINSRVFVLFLLNGVLTIALSHQLILVYEKVFGLVSDVSLLEWSNTNSKLLKRLADKAPGTFNHSLQVANLAEAAANEIGANALLVRAGALYHDIGKMLNPFYFTENQTSGVNRHDDLDPIESAKIIINHVLDGIELARKNNLPDRLIDFIRTHHGTSLVQYFYIKAKDKNPDVDPELFRYPGPNPFSKETAILMMADSVEAASKSLREPTAEKIDTFVDKIIDYQLHEGLLDNADITLQEITEIKKLFKKKLKNIYHLRVAYPE